MTTPTTEPGDRPPNTHTHDATPTTLRQDEESGVFEVRLPIATTGEVRNDGDEPLTRGELDGMAQQIGQSVVSVFPDHGQSSVGGPSRYSVTEKGGEWTDAEVRGESDAESGETELVATARLMDPDSLPDIPVRDFVGQVKELANRDMSVSASIGWADSDNAPGGVDLMEASMVGIPADPRTQSDADTAGMIARAAMSAGADPDALVDAVRDVVARNLDDPAYSEGDKVMWTFDDTPVHGRVADIHEQFTPPDSDTTITGDDGEAVYSIHEYDEDVEAFRRQNVAKPQSSLDASERELPPATEENFVSENDDTPEDGGTNDADEQPTELSADEFRQEMIDLQRQQMEVLETLAGDGDDMDDDDDEEQAADTPDDTDTEEEEGERSALREEVDALKDELDSVREGGVTAEDVDTPDRDTTTSDDDSEQSGTDDRATKEVLK